MISDSVGGSFFTNISVSLTEPTGREMKPPNPSLPPSIISVTPSSYIDDNEGVAAA